MGRLFLLLAFVPLFTYSQQRIAVDLSSKFNSMCLTTSYMYNFKGGFLLSGGLFIGKFGHGSMEMSMEGFESGRRIQTPFPEMNKLEWDTDQNSYELYQYNSKGAGVGIQGGVGYYHEFSVQHGIRFNVNLRAGWMKSKLSPIYFNEDQGFLQKRKEQSHFAGAVSPELYHTIRLNGRITFFYGVKAPYFFTFDKAKFNPRYSKDIFYYWEPELALGLTYVVGKCD